MQSAYRSLIFIKLFQRTCQLLLALSIVVICFTGCSRRYDDYAVYTPFYMKEYSNYGVGRFKSSYLVSQIDNYYRGVNPGPIGVATFVNIDDLYNTSTLGRVYSEQVMSELAMRGFDVVELRHSDAMQLMAAEGEFALSRDVAVLRRARDLGGIVVGTYAVSPQRVYVNARLIDPGTSLVHAAASVEMPKTQEIARLLRGGAFHPTLERIPVRHLNNNAYPLAWNPAMLAQRWEMEELSQTALPPQPLIGADSTKTAVIPNITKNTIK